MKTKTELTKDGAFADWNKSMDELQEIYQNQYRRLDDEGAALLVEVFRSIPRDKHTGELDIRLAELLCFIANGDEEMEANYREDLINDSWRDGFERLKSALIDFDNHRKETL